ncbi:MAG TPA: hypothetical protein VGF67_15670 [Ktedonobacteraceae bacterium]
MRNIVLNMTMTLDGFFCGPNGELDWMAQTPDQELNDDLVAFFQSMDQGFIGPRDAQRDALLTKAASEACSML